LQGVPFPGWDSAPSAVAALAVVPEPTTCGIAILTATGLLARPRRRRLVFATPLQEGAV